MTAQKTLCWAMLRASRRCLALVLALAVCLLVLNGCGDSGTPSTAESGTPSTPDRGTASTPETGKPSTVIYLWYDIERSLSDAEMTETMRQLENVVRKRAEGFGAEVTNVERRERGELAIDVSGMTLDEADALFAPAGLVDFREPERNEAGDIVCEDSGGNLFTVPGDKVPDAMGDLRAAYIVTDRHGDLTQCQAPSDTAPRGSVVWTPAKGVGSDGVEKALTSRFLEPNSELFFDQLGRPLLKMRFDAEGASLFDQITTRLVGFPLAICLDGEIISVSTIRDRISGGGAVVEGLAEDEVRTLAIQLNSGPLPESADIRAVGERWPTGAEKPTP